MLKYISICLLLISCVGNIPEQKEYELFLPITLSADTTEIVIQDFLMDQKIDSISSDVDYILSEDKRKIFFISDDETPKLSVLKLWAQGISYSILVKKNRKKKVVLSYYPNGEEFSKVSIAGEFNDWNPSLSPMKLVDGIWQLEQFMNSGNYQYQMVLNGEWRLDDGNPKTVSNGHGELNSLLEVEGDTGKTPKLSFQLVEGNIQIISENTNEILVFCNNTQIENKEFLVIPKKIKQKQYSHVRVFSFNNNGESNSLLIPLQFGKVITESSHLHKKDKFLANLYFILVDRFLNGNTENDNPIDDKEVHQKANYHGGDLDGILQKLEEG